jgi:DNA-binding IclR family transcriptional regulator
MVKNSESIQVIDRMVCIFDLLAKSEAAMTLKQLSIDAKLASSTTFRILSSLKTHGLIEQDKSNRYQLGRRFLHYAKNISDEDDVRELIKPLMQSLCEKTQETVNLSIHQGNDLVYIERILSPNILRADVAIGKRTPLHVTAVGKLILGMMSEANFNDYLKNVSLISYTDKTITCPNALRVHCLQALDQGIATEHEEAERGLGCIGVLLYNKADGQLFGLSISAPIERLCDAWHSLLQDARCDMIVKLT